MTLEANNTFSHTADYVYVDEALKARWAPFEKLVAEFDSFVPRKIEDYAGERAAELVRLKELNPESSDEDLLSIIDGQISGRSSPSMQVFLKFNKPIMAEYVTVTFLSHALCEATINALLAVGISRVGAHDLFEVLEKAEIKEKWRVGPKAFHPSYELPKDQLLYQTLQHLTRQRNSLIHYKITLEMAGKEVLKGSKLDRSSLGDHIKWIRRYFSLPYDLAHHFQTFVPNTFAFTFTFSHPIERLNLHEVVRRG